MTRGAAPGDTGRTRRRLGGVVTSALAVLALTAGCSTSTGGGSDGGTADGTGADDPLDTLDVDADADADADYAETMAAICTATDERIAALPEPPGQISRENWAVEVARAYRAEYEATDGLLVDGEIREAHRTYVATTEDLAAAWARLAEQLAADPDGIAEINVEITELALGRDELADELGVAACRRSAG